MIVKICRSSDELFPTEEKAPCKKAILLSKELSWEDDDTVPETLREKHYEMEWGIEINTLEDIKAIIAETKCSVIIKKDGSLEIYDDWRE